MQLCALARQDGTGPDGGRGETHEEHWDHDFRRRPEVELPKLLQHVPAHAHQHQREEVLEHAQEPHACAHDGLFDERHRAAECGFGGAGRGRGRETVSWERVRDGG